MEQEILNYNDLTGINNLFQAWNEFRKGKKQRRDLQIFERYLEDNLFMLQNALQTKKRVSERLKQKMSKLSASEIGEENFEQSLQSYLGYLGHANSYNRPAENLGLLARG